MPEPALNILVVIGSLNEDSVTRAVLTRLAENLRAAGCHVDVLDLLHEPLPLYNPKTAHQSASFPPLKARVERADVFVLGTPDYHGSISSALKNFLDHFWKEFAGKLFATVVASHEKGLTVTDQLRTVARQCYAWALPYGVAFQEGEDVREGFIVSEPFRQRMAMFERDLRVYGGLLARQRRADLAGTDAGFMARHRK
jgi:FMN reductase